MLELHLKAEYDEILNAIADKLNQNEQQHQDPFLLQLWQSKVPLPMSCMIARVFLNFEVPTR
jgi:hypothetical protein